MSTFFREGDVVMLRCGGYEMVVTKGNTYNNDAVSCAWHSQNGEPLAHTYPAPALCPVPEGYKPSKSSP